MLEYVVFRLREVYVFPVQLYCTVEIIQYHTVDV